MSSNITASMFLEAVRRSGLITPERLKRLVSDFERDGVDSSEPLALSAQFVRGGYLTSWQADKLLKGKHRGFLLGKYRLLGLLGKGGMSSVYLAEHTMMRRRCALKVLPSKLVSDISYLQRFHREAQAVASLDHRNIVRAYDVDHVVDEGAEIHFLVMEYVEGQSLQEMVRKDGPIAFGECAEYLRQAAEGLSHAHRAGLIHRDVKPGNLLIDTNGVVRILDLGLARYFHEADESSITVHRGEGLLGTVDYLAPEQALDSHAVDFRADIYGLGCSGYFALTGHAPFHTGTVPERILSHQTKDIPAISDERPDVPASLEAIVNRMLQKKPEDRYQTADEVAEAFSAWLAEEEQASVVSVPSAVQESETEPAPDTTTTESAADTGVAEPAVDTSVGEQAPAPVEESPAPASEPAVEAAPPAVVSEPVVSENVAHSAPAQEGFPDFSAMEEPVPAVPVVPAAPAPPTPAAPAPEGFPDFSALEEPAQASSVVPDAPVPASPAPEGFPDFSAVEEPVPADPVVPAAPAPVAPAAPVPEEFPSFPAFGEPAPDAPVIPVAPLPPAPTVPVSEGGPDFSVAEEPPAAAPVVPAASTPPAVASPAPEGFPDFSAVEEPAPAAPVVPAATTSPAAPASEIPDFAAPEPVGGFDVPTAEVAETAGMAEMVDESAPVVPTFGEDSGGALPFNIAPTGVSPVATASTIAPRRRSRGPLVAFVIVGLLVVGGGGFAAWKSGLFTSGSEEAKSTTTTKKPSAAAQAKTAKKAESATEFLGRQIRIGPGGDLPSISDALEYVRRNKSSYTPLGRRDAITILVPHGKTLSDRIDLDNSAFTYPSMHIRIASDGEELAVLAPSGSQPVISLKKMERVRIDGLEIKAKGKAVAVELTECGQTTRLTRLNISGFSKAGIRATRLAGLGSTDGYVSFERLEIRSEDSQAVGIRFEGNSQYVQLRNSRFLGPMSAGVLIDGDFGFAKVQENIFSGVADGVRCTGSNRVWRDVAIANNTFHKGTRGVVFAEMPMSTSSELVICRNLFTGMEGPEAVVEKGYVAETFFSLCSNVGMGDNWSDRNVPPDASKGEHRVVQRDEERVAKKFQLLSENPKDPKFLAPPAQSPLTRVHRPGQVFKPYVGAVKP